MYVYTHVNLHLQWLEKDFLGYLDEWEASVRAREGFTWAEKTSMTLSKETLEGLRLTSVHIMYDCRHSILLISISFIYAVRSFVEATRYLLTLPGVTGQYLLSERFSQDPLENYFSRQRASGGRCDNPTASNTLNCAQSLRVQGSLALQSVRGNCSHKRMLFADKQPVINDTPLPKRPRQK